MADIAEYHMLQNENMSNSAILQGLEFMDFIDTMKCCSQGCSGVVCDTWKKFKPEYYMYWGQDVILHQHIRLQKLWQCRQHPFHGLSQMGVKEKFIYQTGLGGLCFYKDLFGLLF